MSTAGKEAAKKPKDQKVIGSNEQGRAKMSDAGEEAKKDPDDQRVVDSDEAAQRRVFEDEQEGIATSGVALGVTGNEYQEYDEYGQPMETQPEEPTDDGFIYVGLIGGYGTLTGEEINGYPTFGLVFGGTSKTDGFGGEIRAMVGFPRLTDATGIAEGIKDEEELAIDFVFKWYTTPVHTFVGFCFIGGLRWGMLNWQYENPIEYDDGFGEIYEISGDNLQYLTPFLGVGLNLVQTKHIILGTDITGGYKFYKWNTEEGFDNDVLDDEWMVQLLVNISWAFGR